MAQQWLIKDQAPWPTPLFPCPMVSGWLLAARVPDIGSRVLNCELPKDHGHRRGNTAEWRAQKFGAKMPVCDCLVTVAVAAGESCTGRSVMLRPCFSLIGTCSLQQTASSR